MPGMIVFKSLAEAIRQGYEIYDRTPNGYLVRTKTARGFALAFVDLKSPI